MTLSHDDEDCQDQHSHVLGHELLGPLVYCQFFSLDRQELSPEHATHAITIINESRFFKVYLLFQ